MVSILGELWPWALLQLRNASDREQSDVGFEDGEERESDFLGRFPQKLSFMRSRNREIERLALPERGGEKGDIVANEVDGESSRRERSLRPRMLGGEMRASVVREAGSPRLGVWPLCSLGDRCMRSTLVLRLAIRDAEAAVLEALPWEVTGVMKL